MHHCSGNVHYGNCQKYNRKEPLDGVRVLHQEWNEQENVESFSNIVVEEGEVFVDELKFLDLQIELWDQENEDEEGEDHCREQHDHEWVLQFLLNKHCRCACLYRRNGGCVCRDNHFGLNQFTTLSEVVESDGPPDHH